MILLVDGGGMIPPHEFLLVLFLPLSIPFELDESANNVECIECVQTWPSSTGYSSAPKCNHAKTCTANACFMRQCKHCPVYQFILGCVTLSRWQLSDLEFARREADLRLRRVGASLLCEDTFNQTTCICNRRDKCNSMHSNLPYTTYAEGLFTGIVDIDEAIAQVDPSYLPIVRGGRQSLHFNAGSSLIFQCSYFITPFLLLQHRILVQE